MRMKLTGAEMVAPVRLPKPNAHMLVGVDPVDAPTTRYPVLVDLPDEKPFREQRDVIPESLTVLEKEVLAGPIESIDPIYSAVRLDRREGK